MIIRLRFDNGNPSQPIAWDDQTRKRPAIDTGGSAQLQIGVFSLEQPLDLTDYTSFVLRLRPNAELVADMSVINCTLLTGTITRDAWFSGSDKHLIAEMTSDHTGFQIKTSAYRAWVVLTARDPEGNNVTLGKGDFFITRDNSEPGSPPALTTYPSMEQLTNAVAVETARATAAEDALKTQTDALQVGMPSKTIEEAEYVLTAADAGYWLKFSAATAIAVTLPAQADVSWPANTEIVFERIGDGNITLVTAEGVTANPEDKRVTADAFTPFALKRSAEDTWTVLGELDPASE